LEKSLVGTLNKAFEGLALTLAQAGAVTYTLTDVDGRNQSTVRIQAKYVPVEIKLDPRESINSMFARVELLAYDSHARLDMGILRVELLDGKDIHGADRSGEQAADHGRHHTNTFTRQIRSICHLHPQWHQSVQEPDQEEDLGARVERVL
jgi:hypothetical protein